MTWAAGMFVFFSTASSKMVHYILPLLPAVALLMGRALAGLAAGGWQGPATPGVRASLTALAVAVVAAGLAPLAVAAGNPDIGYAQVGVFLLLVPCLAVGVGIAVFRLRDRLWAAVAAPLLLFVLMWPRRLASLLEPYRSVKGLVGQLAGVIKPGDLVVNYGDYYLGTPFYLSQLRPGPGQARMAVVRNWGELDYGRRQDPQSRPWFIASDEEFVKLLLDTRRRVVALAEVAVYERFLAKVKDTPGLLLLEWSRRGDKLVFSNRPR